MRVTSGGLFATFSFSIPPWMHFGRGRRLLGGHFCSYGHCVNMYDVFVLCLKSNEILSFPQFRRHSSQEQACSTCVSFGFFAE